MGIHGREANVGRDCNTDRQQRSGQGFGDGVLRRLTRHTVAIYCAVEHGREPSFYWVGTKRVNRPWKR